MSIAHTSKSQNLQVNFGEKLSEVQEWLNDKSIPYLIIGSVATAAHVDSEGSWVLNFDRPQATSPEDRIPDIDLVVPRNTLPNVRKYREKLLTSTFPVSIGLAFPSRFIDMRADEPISFLTSGRQRYAVETHTLKPQPETVLNTNVMVPNVTTLYYIQHMIGRLRPSDTVKASALANHVNEIAVGYDPYKQMIRHRKDHPGMVSRIGRAQRHLSDNHPVIANQIHKAVLPVANVLGAR